MKKTALALALIALAAPAFATGNGAPSGPHYNLNIIGVKSGKKVNLDNSNGHRIFVKLGKTDETAQSRIYLTAGDFAVCDANATQIDTGAYDCEGNKIANSGAVFQLPCNTNLSTDGGYDLVPCDVNETSYYEVWVRAVGTPGGSATITTCAYDPDLGSEVCSTENVMLVRERNKPMFENKTKELTSLIANIDDDVQLERVALFAGGLEDWFWKYDNNGLKVAQMRFYEMP